MTLFIPILLSLLAGFAVPLQAGTNARLGQLLGHPLWATGVSLLISLLALALILIFIKVPRPNLVAALQNGPWWIWMGGIAGVFYITTALLIAPRLGTLNFIMAVIVGQLAISLIIDRFGLVGLPQREVSLKKLVGVAIVIVGFLITTRA